MSTTRKLSYIVGSAAGVVLVTALGWDPGVTIGFAIGCTWVCIGQTVAPES